ncbi:MAG: hypothetical protein PUB96_01405, partial [Helicobacteraceae bacterium]|nr:hypothetical protein [Helicobacteraceae bacterium]
AIRYAYGLEKDGVKFRLVVDEYNDGKKIFDYYSDRNFINYSDSTTLQANPHISSGILSGSVAGIESDEDGNISINPQAFLAGLIGGSVGSKGISKATQAATKHYSKKLTQSYPNIAKENPQLFKEIFKNKVKFDFLKENYNGLTRFFNNNKIFDLNPQIIAGEKALLNKAYEPQKARLQKAKDMQKQGKSEVEIWEKTGWYLDLDNKWKFEINRMGGVLLKLDFKEAKLKEILEDKELFKAYPQLQDLTIKAEKDGVADGFYDNLKKYIGISPYNLEKGDKRRIKSILYHELQHAVQDLENFAKGGNDSVMGYKNYKNTWGEVEARNVEARLKKEIGADKKDIENYKEGLEIQEKLNNNEISDYTKATLKQNSKKTLKQMPQLKQKLEYSGDKSGFIDTHPYSTIDILLKDGIVNKEAREAALSVDIDKIAKNAIDLPQRDFKNVKEFSLKFDRLESSSKGFINTPLGEIKINPYYAFIHFFKNSKNENRLNIASGFFETFKNPSFILKEKESIYFYKPFLSEKGEFLGLFGVGVSDKGKLTHRTFYKDKANNARLKRLMKEAEVLYSEDLPRK